jgi:hypothetical protein
MGWGFPSGWKRQSRFEYCDGFKILLENSQTSLTKQQNSKENYQNILLQFLFLYLFLQP